ncbi:MAG: hypothetical protein M1820_000083 [Bogoriella megaspora]|nr:MAG: hypothetical protein M1820_000083 [Bogoriella megaspora]
MANYTVPASLADVAGHLKPPKDAVLVNSTHVALFTESDLYASTITTLTIPFRTNIALTPDTIQWSGIIPTTSMGLSTCVTHTSYQAENLPSIPTPSTSLASVASGSGYLNLDQDPYGWTWHYHGPEQFIYKQSELSHQYPAIAALQNGTCNTPRECSFTLVSPIETSSAAILLTVTNTGYESDATENAKPPFQPVTESRTSEDPPTTTSTPTPDSKPASAYEKPTVNHAPSNRPSIIGNSITSSVSGIDSLMSPGIAVSTTSAAVSSETKSGSIDRDSSAASHTVSGSASHPSSSTPKTKDQTKPTTIQSIVGSVSTESLTHRETSAYVPSTSSGVSLSENRQPTESISSTLLSKSSNGAPDSTSLPHVIAPVSLIMNGESASSKKTIVTSSSTNFRTAAGVNSQISIGDSIADTTTAPYLTLGSQLYSPIITAGRTAYSIAPDIVITAGGPATLISGSTISLASSATALVMNGITTPVSAILQGDISLPDLTDNGNVYTPTSISGSPAYSIGAGSVLLPGGPAITLSGSTYSLASSGTALIVNGVTSALSEHLISSADPLILNGDTYTPTFVSSTAEYSIAPGQTLIPGASALTLSGQTISLDPDASRLIINGQTSTLSAPTKTTLGPGLGSYIASGFAGPTGTGSNPQEFTGAGSPEVNRRFFGLIVCCVAIVSLRIVLW